MWWWVVKVTSISLTIAMLATAGLSSANIRSGQLDALETAAWARLQNSIVYLELGVQGGAVAAYVGNDGLFIVQRSVITSNVLRGHRPNGDKMNFLVVSRDAPSQLALLKAESGYEKMIPVKAPPVGLTSGRGLLAVLWTGPFRAELTSSQKIGVLSSSRRLVPLNEIRFEAPGGPLGNALVFTREGNFVGAIYATLNAATNQMNVANQSGQAGFGGQGGVVPLSQGPSQDGRTRDTQNGLPMQKGIAPTEITQYQNYGMGPLSLVVAYTPSAEITAKAFSGFLSEDKTPKYAALGVMCKDAVGGGALVQSIDAGSAAAKAGMLANDVIESMGGYPVKNQIDFAKVLYKMEPGQKLAIRVRRAGVPHNFEATLGAITIR